MYVAGAGNSGNFRFVPSNWCPILEFVDVVNYDFTRLAKRKPQTGHALNLRTLGQQQWLTNFGSEMYVHDMYVGFTK